MWDFPCSIRFVFIKDGLSGLIQFLANENPFKNNEKCYLFHLKIYFLSQNSCLDLLVMQKIGLIRKIRLISKFVTSQPGTPIISIHILPNILRSKGNQTIKFNQLIEYYRRNILLEKPYTKCSGAWNGETIPRRFSKKSKLSISLDQ